MRKKPAILLVAFATIVFLAGCGLNYNQQAPANSDQNQPEQPASGTRQGDQAIIIQNFAFSPAALTISKGTTVTWANRDSVPHSIKSGTFNSSPLNTSESFSFTFNETGTFDYICGIHPSMKGQIIVQ